MPGLVGIVSAKDDATRVLADMAHGVTHRSGQSADSYDAPPFRAACVSLGDSIGEGQRMASTEDGTVVAMVYGRIHGLKQEGQRLEGKHSFRSEAAAEYCAHAYEEYGRDFAARLRLNGFFTVLIWDRQAHSLLVLNDRFGQCPLHYTQCGSELLFATEAKGLLESGRLRRQIDEIGMEDHLTIGTVLGDRTLFEGVQLLPPASMLVFRDSHLHVHHWWPYFRHSVSHRVPAHEHSERLAATLTRAVEAQLPAGECHGLLLSGGLDSRLVLAAVPPERRQTLTTITYGVDGCNDARIAEAIARLAQTKHVFCCLSPDKVARHMVDSVYLTDGAYVPHGGAAVAVHEELPPGLRSLCEGLTLEVILKGSYLSEALLRGRGDADVVPLLDRRRVFGDEAMAHLLLGSYGSDEARLPRTRIACILREYEGAPWEKAERFVMQHLQRRHFVMAGSFIRPNYVGMTAPTYDNEFVDAALAVPAELKLGGRMQIAVMRRLDERMACWTYANTMVSPCLPQAVTHTALMWQSGKARAYRYLSQLSGGALVSLTDRRPFAPFGQWLQYERSWQAIVRWALLSPDSRIRAYCNQQYVSGLLEQHVAGKMGHFLRLDALLGLEFSIRLFIERQGREDMNLELSQVLRASKLDTNS